MLCLKTSSWHYVFKENHENPTKNENNGTIATISKDQNNNTELDIIDYNNLPVPLQKYVQSESWEEAILYCQQQKFNDLGECLSFVKKSLSSNESIPGTFVG